jgi:hypothetical protein
VHGLRYAYLDYLDGEEPQFIGYFRSRSISYVNKLNCDYTFDLSTGRHYVVENDYTTASQVE